MEELIASLFILNAPQKLKSSTTTTDQQRRRRSKNDDNPREHANTFDDNSDNNDEGEVDEMGSGGTRNGADKQWMQPVQRYKFLRIQQQSERHV